MTHTFLAAELKMMKSTKIIIMRTGFSNETIRSDLNVEPLLKTFKNGRPRCSGHVMSDDKNIEHL